MSEPQQLHLQWDSLKSILEELYISQNRTLPVVMAHMQESYDFRATKGQYENQFKEWNFRKNLTSSEWDYVHPCVQKRVLTGQDSDVYLNGNLIPRKRVKKEIARRYPPSSKDFSVAASIPKTPEGISVQTPPSSDDFIMSTTLSEFQEPTELQTIQNMSTALEGSYLLDCQLSPSFFEMLGNQQYNEFSRDGSVPVFSPRNTAVPPFGRGFSLTLMCSTGHSIDLSNLPWFRFQALVESQGRFQYPPWMTCLDFECTSEKDRYVIEETNICFPTEPDMTTLLPMSLSPPEPIASQSSDPIDLVSSESALDDVSLVEKHKLVAGWLGSVVRIDGTVDLSLLHSQIQAIALEKYDGEFLTMIQKFFDPCKSSSFFQLLELASYLLSNNLMSEQKTDELLKWIIEKKYDSTLKSFVETKAPTIYAFTTKVLESALRINSDNMFELLLSSGFDATSFHGSYGGRCLQVIAKTGNVEIAKVLLRNGAQLNFRGWESGPPVLYTAVIHNRIEIVQLLVDAGANVNDRCSYDDYNPLALAVRYYSAKIVSILVDAGADVDSCTIDKHTVIEWSVLYGKQEIHEFLVSKSKMRKNLVTVDGITKAAARGTRSLGLYLREKVDGDVSEVSRELELALRYEASKGEHISIASLLELGVNVKFSQGKQVFWDDPLVSAAELGDYELFRILMRAGAEFNTPEVLQAAVYHDEGKLGLLVMLFEEGADFKVNGGKAVQSAASHCNTEAVQFLIWGGADVNAPPLGECTQTALEAAANNPEMIQLLLDRGADVNLPGNPEDGRTALQSAVDVQNLESIRILLAAGADVNAPAGYRACTALQVATCNDNLEIFDILLKAGADVNSPGALIDGQTALQAAVMGNKDSSVAIELVQRLLAAGAEVNVPENGHMSTLQCAVRSQNVVLVEMLLEAGININTTPKGNEGRSPLQEAAEIGNVTLVKMLLKAGANVDAAAGIGYGRTALQAAASADTPNMDVIELLLKAGANVNAAAGFKGGCTALQGAVIRGHIGIVIRLLEAGADVNSPAAIVEGRTALDAAVENGRLDITQLLLNAGGKNDLKVDRLGRAIELAKNNGHYAIVNILREEMIEKGR